MRCTIDGRSNYFARPSLADHPRQVRLAAFLHLVKSEATDATVKRPHSRLTCSRHSEIKGWRLDKAAHGERITEFNRPAIDRKRRYGPRHHWVLLNMNVVSFPNEWRGKGRLSTFVRASVPVILVAAVLLTITASYGAHRFGSIESAISYLKGDRIIVDKAFKTVSAHRPNEQVVVDYRLTNISGRPVKLAGVATSCTCTAVDGVPTILESKETRVFSARIAADEIKDALTGEIRIFTDEPSTPELKLSYKVQANPPR